MKITELSPAHAIKLAALAVHAEEYFETMAKGRPLDAQFDYHSIEGLLADTQVREVLDDPDNRVFLPVWR